MDKRLKDGLSDMITAVLREPTCNTHILSEVLPRPIQNQKHRYQYISRALKNPHIDCHRIMPPYVKELAIYVTQKHQALILQMDQSKVALGFEVLMVSMRLGERTLPIAWTVKQTEGNIGFEDQEVLLDHVYTMLPHEQAVVLMTDRFYGTKALVGWCQKHGFAYRIRLKGNLLFHHEDALLSPMEAHTMGMDSLENATFHKSDITTHIGIVQEVGHPEPWFIAMDAQPSLYRTLDYGMRWGIESLFSDFKSRGFGITDSHLQHADRLERLILVLTLALYWATSTGMYAIHHHTESGQPTSKKKETIRFVSLHEGHALFDAFHLV